MTHQLTFDDFRLISASSVFLAIVGLAVFDLAIAPAYLVASYVVFALAICKNTTKVLRRFDRNIVWAVVLFFASAALAINVQNATSGSMKDFLGRDAYSFASGHILLALLYFSFGVVAVLPENNNHRLVPLLGMAGLYLILFHSGLGFIDYERLSEYSTRPVDHLALGDPVLILTFVLAASSKGATKYLILCLGLVAVFLIQSRTAFFLGLMISVCRVAFLAPRLGLRGASLVFSVLGAAYASGRGLEVEQGRMFFQTEASYGGSALIRLEQFEVGFAALSTQTLIGDMNFPVVQLDNLGGYMHNIMSYWQQYGLFVFLVFLALLFVVARCASRDYAVLRQFCNPTAEVRFMVAGYAIIATLVSKSFAFYWVWFGVGLYCSGRGRELIKERQALDKPVARLIRSSRGSR